MSFRTRRFLAPYGKAAAGAATTWDPANTNAAITLSNGNLTATQNTAGGFRAYRALASHTTGKYYFEIHADTASANYFSGIGNASASLADFPGDNNNSISIGSDGKVWLNGTNPTGSPVLAWTTGDTLSVAVDMGNTKIWFRTNGSGWNNDVIGNQNPATNTGGISFSTMAAGPWFPMDASGVLNDAFTANFGGTAYAQSTPAGYGNW